jgi:hypothetical protein
VIQSVQPVIRDAIDDDLAAICGFGEVHLRAYYMPIIGEGPAAERARRWWNGTNESGGWPCRNLSGWLHE